MEMGRRILSVFIVAIMLVASVDITALAAGVEETGVSIPDADDNRYKLRLFI